MTEYYRDNVSISTDKSRLDVGLVHEFLSECSYWAQGRPLDIAQKSIEHSLCFGMYDGDQQVGFARVVTDYATFGWLCDVFILESHRGRGLGKWMIECVVAYPDCRVLRTFCWRLATLTNCTASMADLRVWRSRRNGWREPLG